MNVSRAGDLRKLGDQLGNHSMYDAVLGNGLDIRACTKSIQCVLIEVSGEAVDDVPFMGDSGVSLDLADQTTPRSTWFQGDEEPAGSFTGKALDSVDGGRCAEC